MAMLTQSYISLLLTKQFIECKYFTFTLALYKQPGRVAVITGGNRGIGLRIVEKLLACDITVIMGKLECFQILLI